MNCLVFNINMNINTNFSTSFAVVKLLTIFRKLTFYFADLSKRNNVLVMLFCPCKANIMDM
jgi:hypothetical protein